MHIKGLKPSVNAFDILRCRSNLRFDSSAFTLIEIIIVILIIASFTGMVGVNYVQYTEERKLQQSVSQIKAVMVLARSRALSGDVASYPCGDFNGFRVITDSLDSRSVSLTLCCAASCANPSFEQQNYTISSNTVIKNQFSIIFKPFAQGVEPDQQQTITVNNTFIRKCVDITVTRIGIIDTGEVYGC